LTLVSVAPGVSCDNTAATIAANKVDCTFAHLAAGGSLTVTGTYKVASNVLPQSVTNTATGASDEASATGSGTVGVATSADMTISKTGPASAYYLNNVTYTITVNNTGPSDAQSVVV